MFVYIVKCSSGEIMKVFTSKIKACNYLTQLKNIPSFHSYSLIEMWAE